MTPRRVLCCVLLSALSISASAKERPNIVLVMADDQGWGQVGYNGHPLLKTPHLDAMAESGIRFNRFYAAGPVCSPTRASVLTGRTHNRTGVPSHGKRLCLQEKTLPQALKRAGYSTAHFGKWHLNGVRGPGIPILGDDRNHPGHYGFDEWLSVTNFFDLDPLMSRNGKFEAFKGDSSEIIVAEALKFMKQQKDTPFLAVIWYGSPHNPMQALDKDRKGLSDDKLGHHLGEVAGIDRSVGVLRQGLRKLGIEKDTIVWYCSDNGGLNIDPHGVGPLKGHKGSVLEGGIRVPGIVEWPGRIEPAITDVPASTMDIMPTIIDLLDLSETSMLSVRDGESILPLFSGARSKRSRPIPFVFLKNAAIIDGNFKLLSQNTGKEDSWRLYDLKDDPAETKDLSGALPDRFGRMKVEAEALLRSVEASAAGKDYTEGRVLQPQRSQFWRDMEAYQPHFETFARLKPGFPVPVKKTPGKKRPNVIVIMADDIGAEGLGCYGSQIYTTPNLDRMATEGVRFDNAYATPLCTPTRVMIMSGLYPNRTGFRTLISKEPGVRMPAKIKTFGHYFRDAGYQTAIAGKWQLGKFDEYPGQPIEHGFDEYCMWSWIYKEKKTSRYYSPHYHTDGKPTQGTEEDYGPDFYSEFVLDFIDRNKEEPFFIYYPMALVHSPFIHPPELEALARTKFTDDLPKSTQAFGHMITYMDDIIGRILARLARHDIDKNTLVIFTGDNGTHKNITSRLPGMDIKGGKGSMTEAGCRVPFLAWWPGKIDPAVRDEFFCLVDILPTITSVANIGLTGKVDGMDLSHNLLGKRGENRPHVLMSYRTGFFVRDKRYRLHEDGRLYDIPVTSDKTRYRETVTTDPEHESRRKRLQGILDRFMAIKQLGSEETDPSSEGQRTLDKDER